MTKQTNTATFETSRGKMHQLITILLLSLFHFFLVSNAADFCVADLTAARTFAGYSCKDPATVTVDDFVFTNFEVPADTNTNISAGFVPALVRQFPALNGLGLSLVRIDYAPGGWFPIHSHPAASEIVYIQSGSVISGFISSASVLYVKKLNAGDVMIYPRGLLHFQLNAANGTTTAIAAFSDPEPGLQITPNSLFGNNLGTDILEKVTYLSAPEIQRLKGVFGGSG